MKTSCLFTDPTVGSHSPLATRRTEVLPQPDGPTTSKRSPGPQRLRFRVNVRTRLNCNLEETQRETVLKPLDFAPLCFTLNLLQLTATGHISASGPLTRSNPPPEAAQSQVLSLLRCAAASDSGSCHSKLKIAL